MQLSLKEVFRKRLAVSSFLRYNGITKNLITLSVLQRENIIVL